ncbi:MAG: hypothetical protein Q7T58_05840 [Methylotenera sp.]|nr:hypothetical protein [Methylotenera sp.]
MSAKKHPHILLAENHAGTASYCDTCHMVELEIGAISLRVDENTLALLGRLLRDADYRLNVYQNERQKFIQDLPSDLRFH